MDYLENTAFIFQHSSFIFSPMKWISDSPSNTWKIAAEFFQTLELPAVVALHGNLGAGKTCFTQGLAQAAGVAEPVCSPTYTLVSEYQGDIPFHHIDLYRLSGPEEAYDLGLDEIFERAGITVIEWAERAAELIPPRAVHVRLEHGDGAHIRTIEIISNSSPPDFYQR
jgi:tRNA threonylcarbamoyladenosine biosynthesis protein TsaE